MPTATPTPTETPMPTATPPPTETPTVVAPRTVDIANNDQDVTVFGEDTNNLVTEVADILGVAVAATGDFNADGIMDILIGASGADGPDNTRDHAGEAYAIFGTTDLPAQIDVVGTAGPQPDVRIFGEETGLPSTLYTLPGDSLGEVITTGDLNDDGYDDVIVASPLADGPGNARPDAGGVYVFFGRSEEDWDSMRASPDAPIIFDVASTAGPEPDVVIHGAEEEDVLGCSLATGDVDDDGIDDLLVGACYADGPANERREAGEAYVFFGRPSEGWQSVSPIDLGASPNPADVTFYGVDPGDYLGGALASAGDANGDGLDDILIGARQADGAGNASLDAGEAHLFFGRDTTSWLSLTPLDLSITNADVTIWGADAGDNMTTLLGLSMGDVNGDGIGDLLIGAPFAAGPEDSRPSSGEAYAIFGRQTWAATIDLSNTPADVTIYGVDPDDRLGSSITGGDVHGDGLDDILLGAPAADGPGNERPDWTGEAYLIHGRAFSVGQVIDLATPGTARTTIWGAETYDLLGHATSIGDVSGDQVPDIVVGAYLAYGPNNGRPEAGEAYVVFGP
jgi:hypothetical protein